MVLPTLSWALTFIRTTSQRHAHRPTHSSLVVLGCIRLTSKANLHIQLSTNILYLLPLVDHPHYQKQQCVWGGELTTVQISLLNSCYVCDPKQHLLPLKYLRYHIDKKAIW